MTGPVYVITDPDAPLPVVELALAAARGGAGLIQIRDKRAADAEIAALVARLLPRLAALGARLIVNDWIEVALRTGAHGLHIGQSDGDVQDSRQRLMLAARFVAASVGVDRVPTEVMGRPSVVIVVVTEGDQLTIRFTPKCGCNGKSRPEGRMTSIHGAPARLQA